ncbi:DNA polymerase domain-containing protein [Candidatus Nitrososphaera sp. FF02]|uniref:DNA polymerase domain-containing protein n=1 Tax=Candidatus Nitrososphaera sp. FF02 TaxID=3398226 RepID=UPI0039E7AEF2
MILWLKTESGQAVRVVDNWSHSIYVAADSVQALERLAKNAAVQYYVKSSKFVRRQERINDAKESMVLQLTLKDSAKAVSLASTIEDIDFDAYRLYNVDILPAQAYFYEHDLYPLAKCQVSQQNGRLIWQFKDDLHDTDYTVPDFVKASLTVSIKKAGLIPKHTDKIEKIIIKTGNETVEIQNQAEQDALHEIEREMARIDPDFVFVVDGDEFVMPYLIHRAQANGMSLVIDRERLPLAEPSKKGVTYFAYGQIHYKPSAIALHGRIHVDGHNSFILDHSAMHGLYEIARLCRMPFHTCARATIGRCLSSMQMYEAFKRNLLVPYKPVNVEKFKSFNELLKADRGGLIFEPVIGVHENVAEFDFTALYPSIMAKRNISGETVNCACCPESQNIVKELGYRICEKRRGIVSKSLELSLEKRVKYKQLKKVTSGRLYDIYDARQDALKWLGVVSFGYLGHANSKFGLIDSHIAVCAIDREVLLTARDIAESRGYAILHGIVDSLWVHKQGATKGEYAKLKEPIEKATGYDLSYEGVYKWVVFLASKQNDMIPVPNRYFGVFDDGKIKIRGIEARRHDTPPLFNRFQAEALKIMAQGDNVAQVKVLMPQVQALFDDYCQQLRNDQVPVTDLVFTKSLSKDAKEYKVSTVETGAVAQLDDEGKEMRAGQVLRYVITDYGRKNKRKRSIPVELIDENTSYDVKRYIALLAETGNSVTEPFGCKLAQSKGDLISYGLQ